jgi:hypothetical protein
VRTIDQRFEVTMTTKRSGVLALVLVSTAPCGLAWSEEERPANPEVLVTRRTRASLGASFGAPLGATATIGLLHGLGADVTDESDRIRAIAGVLLQLHAGTGGGKLSLGVGASASGRSEDVKGSASAALKASVVRTWRDPVGTARGQTYLGPELELSVLRVELALGTLARVSGGGGKRVLFTWGLGVRL